MINELSKSKKFKIYKEKFDGVLDVVNNDRNLKQVVSNSYYISDIYGKKMNLYMTVDDFENERSNFVTRLTLDGYFDWKLCEGTFGSITAKKVKQVYSLKNIYEDVINQIFIRLSADSELYMNAVENFINEISNDTNYLYSRINTEFDYSIEELKSRQIAYTETLRKESNQTLADIYNLIFSQFNRTLTKEITTFYEKNKKNINALLFNDEKYLSELVTKSYVLNSTNSKFGSLPEQISVKNSNNLLNFTYFTNKVNQISSVFQNLNNRYGLLFIKVDSMIKNFNYTKLSMSNNYLLLINKSLEQFNSIEKSYNYKITSGLRLIPTTQNNIDSVLEYAYRISQFMNISQEIKRNLNNSMTSLMKYANDSIKFINNVTAYLKNTKDNDYILICEPKREIVINMQIYAIYTNIQTPIKITVPQISGFSPIANDENIATEVKMNHKIQVYGTVEIQTGSYYVQDYINANYDLNLNILVGYSLSKLLFFFGLTTYFTLSKQFFIIEKHSYIYKYQKCCRRGKRVSCWIESEIRWSDKRNIEFIDEKNKIATSSMTKTFQDFLKQSANSLR